MPSPAPIAELAPRGVLRAAINFGNPVLAGKDDAGQACGISVDLARELARRLGVPIELVHYQSAGHVPAALASDAWDVCFLAIDPTRAADIAFTAPYAVIEGAYMVAEASALRGVDEVDRAGTRIGVIEASAYDLYLSRELKHATLVREASITPARRMTSKPAAASSPSVIRVLTTGHLPRPASGWRRGCHRSSEAESRSRMIVTPALRLRIDAGQSGEIGPSKASLTASAFRASGTTTSALPGARRAGIVRVMAWRGTSSRRSNPPS
jgi:hypothetical protein